MEMVHFIPSCQRKLAMQAAHSDVAPTLIVGGAGSGKGAIARWIHQNSARSAKAFITADHHTSLFNQIRDASGGTLFIPEITEWPLSDQHVLTEVLKTHSLVQRDQGTHILVNTRFIVATALNLDKRAQAGLFSAELLSRLNVIRIDMPALSKRSEDFEEVVMGLVHEITREVHKEHLRGLSRDAWAELRGYSWPGNIRELRNVLRMAILAADSDQIETKDLPDFKSMDMDFRATRVEFDKIYVSKLLETYGWDLDRLCQVTRMDPSQIKQKIQSYGLKRGEILSAGSIANPTSATDNQAR